MIHISAQAKRNAGSGPNASRTNTYTPPERGKAAASSEYVSAPHKTTTAPTTHASRNSGTSSIRCATLAGVRKIPLPIVEPTKTATALHKPSRRINRSPQRSAGIIGVDMGMQYTWCVIRGAWERVEIRFPAYVPTFQNTRLVGRHLHLSPDHPRRHCAHHRIGNGLRRSLAAVQRPFLSATRRHRHRDRVEPPVGGGAGFGLGCRVGGVWMVSCSAPRAAARGQAAARS